MTQALDEKDRDKRRCAVCKLDNDHICNMLNNALAVLPQTKLDKLAGQ